MFQKCQWIWVFKTHRLRLRDLLWENRKRNYGDRKWANFVLFAKFLCANFITRFGNLAGSRSSKFLMLLQQRRRKYMPSVSFSIDNRGNSWSKWMFYSGDASKISLVEVGWKLLTLPLNARNYLSMTFWYTWKTLIRWIISRLPMVLFLRDINFVFAPEHARILSRAD